MPSRFMMCSSTPPPLDSRPPTRTPKTNETLLLHPDIRTGCKPFNPRTYLRSQCEEAFLQHE